MHEPKQPAAATVILISADLVFTSRIAAAAEPHGIAVQAAQSGERALELVAEPPRRLVLVDLTTVGLDVESLVPRLRERAAGPLGIVAYGPHVHQAKLDAAARAGCDEVLTRGQFNAQMDAVLRRRG